MRAQVDLLQWLVNRWSIQDQCFVIGAHRLEIELEDIYFLTGFPKRGEQLSLFGKYASFIAKKFEIEIREYAGVCIAQPRILNREYARAHCNSIFIYTLFHN